MADDHSYVLNLHRRLLASSHRLYKLTSCMADEYETRIKRLAHDNPNTQTNINVIESTSRISGVTVEGVMDSVVRVKKPVWDSKRLRADRKASVAAQNACVRRINRRLNKKIPMTHDSIMCLMKQWNIPVDAFVATKVNAIMRKYLTKKEDQFESTCKRTFFSDPPPFLLKNNVAVTWENDIKGLLTTTLDDRGVLVKTPTDIFNAVMVYYTDIIDTAYLDLDVDVPGQSPNVAAIEKVKRHNTFAALVNNISSNLHYNASSMLFTFLRRCRPPINFQQLSTLLADIKFGSQDVEDAYLRSLVDPYMHRYEGETLDRAVADPMNVIFIRGYAYDQIKPALKCEFVLLKVLFYISHEYKGDLLAFLANTYQTKYADGDAPIAVNNVLQLCPGLMTVMFYAINRANDIEGRRLLEQFDRHCKTLMTVKGSGRRQEGIELSKNISKAMEAICIRFIDLVITDTIHRDNIRKYTNLLFLRSGLIKEGAAAHMMM